MNIYSWPLKFVDTVRFCFQYLMVGYLLDTVELHLPKDVNDIVETYTKCQDAAGKSVFDMTIVLLRKLNVCLKKKDQMKYDYNVFFGVQ